MLTEPTKSRAGELRVSLGNKPDYLASTVSFRLGLRGLTIILAGGLVIPTSIDHVPAVQRGLRRQRDSLRFFFLANLTCFVTFKQTSSSKAKHNKTKASCNRWKYKETAENTKNAKITSSHMTKTTTSTLGDKISIK